MLMSPFYVQDNKQDIVFRRKETDGQTGEELKSQTQQEGWRHEALEEEEVDLRDRWVEGDEGTDCISGRKKTDGSDEQQQEPIKTICFI